MSAEKRKYKNRGFANRVLSHPLSILCAGCGEVMTGGGPKKAGGYSRVFKCQTCEKSVMVVDAKEAE